MMDANFNSNLAILSNERFKTIQIANPNYENELKTIDNSLRIGFTFYTLFLVILIGFNGFMTYVYFDAARIINATAQSMDISSDAGIFYLCSAWALFQVIFYTLMLATKIKRNPERQRTLNTILMILVLLHIIVFLCWLTFYDHTDVVLEYAAGSWINYYFVTLGRWSLVVDVFTDVLIPLMIYKSAKRLHLMLTRLDLLRIGNSVKY